MHQYINPLSIGLRSPRLVCQAAGSDAELAAFIKDSLAAFSARALSQKISPPFKQREWVPSPSFASHPPAEIIKRHPAFLWGFEDVPEVKIRQAVRGERRGRLGRFASRKMQRVVRAQSDLEFDCIRWAEFAPDVDGYVEQPVILRYIDRSMWRRHTPDLFIRRIDGQSGFVEVKYEETAAKPLVEAKYAAIGSAVAALGYSYSVLTERQIRRQPAFNTLKTLFLRSRHTHLPDPDTCTVIATILNEAPLSLEAVAARKPEVSMAQLLALILRGFLKIDLDQPLNDSSMIDLTGHQPIRYQGPVA